MPQDNYFISSQTHELNYLLKKWDKKQNRKNREILKEKIKEFKADESYRPHTRGNFYKYVEDNDILKLLEDAAKKKFTGKKHILPDVNAGDLTVDDPYIHPYTHKTESKKTTDRKIKKQKIQIQDLTLHKTHKAAVLSQGKKAEKKGMNGRSKKKLILILIIILVVILLIAIFSVGTCIYQNNQANKKDLDLKEDMYGKNQEGAPDTDEESFTADSLKDFLATCTPVYFKGDLDEIIQGEERKLDELASYLDHYPRVELAINGHTANTGKPADEMDLSIRRANHVATLLKQKTEKADLTMKTRGFGATMEAIKNPSKEKMKLNRRVEISVLNIR